MDFACVFRNIWGSNAHAHGSPRPKFPETLHYTGAVVFTLSGKVIDRRWLFTKGIAAEFHLTTLNDYSSCAWQIRPLFRIFDFSAEQAAVLGSSQQEEIFT